MSPSPLRWLCLGLAAAVAPLAAMAADLTIGLATDVTSIDPHYHNLTPNSNIAQHVYGLLVQRNEKEQLEPGLATQWKTVDPTTLVTSTLDWRSGDDPVSSHRRKCCVTSPGTTPAHRPIDPGAMPSTECGMSAGFGSPVHCTCGRPSSSSQRKPAPDASPSADAVVMTTGNAQPLRAMGAFPTIRTDAERTVAKPNCGSDAAPGTTIDRDSAS